MNRKRIDRKRIRLDFGTFRLSRIEVFRDRWNKKTVKIFYTLNDPSVKDEMSLERRVIYSDTAEDYAALARSYYEKTVLSNAKIFSSTPTGLLASLTI